MAGEVNDKGYLQIYFEGKSYKAHRLAYYLMKGEEAVGNIDHIDGNRLNNKWDNLRLVTPAENSWNQKCSKNSISGIKGLRELPSGSYFGTITKGAQRYTFCSKDKTLVMEWLTETRKELHGEYARD